MKKKKPVTDWLSMMGRTKHLVKEEYQDVVSEIQKEIDRRFKILKIKNETPEL
jgi:pyruvate ferredoxin oxidoreductase alpha subunit